MPDYNLSKMCFLKQLDLIDNTGMSFNWARELNHYLSCIGFDNVWQLQNLKLVQEKYKSILTSFRNNLVSRDVEAIVNSKYNLNYRILSTYDLDEPHLK
uniref:Uncharacterized protein n=1 Tax=Rhodnius prolixus TaxID=13249 RepID=T1I374_RHOPR